ncbi:MAG: PAS domain S-box protein [Verrucomicrobiae bacterium]|nr:PAS domain S-box protein [Verrucomicrobiae bacterium]
MKEVEDSRMESLLSLSDVIETMPDGILALDSDGRIQLWNSPMEKLTGYTAGEVLGAHCSMLECADCRGEDGDKADLPAEVVLMRSSGDASITRIECRIRARNGELVPVLKSARVLRNEAGEVTGLVETVTDLRYRKRLEAEVAQSMTPNGLRKGLGRLVGAGHAMNEVYDRIHLAAQSDATVLIYGSTGTGKELVADAIHRLSSRRHRPFVKVNCSALPESLLESELFGHVKGAFTGASTDKIGRFEAAEGGTLLLDEIGDITPLIQLKLLRVIQERVYERVGESKHRTADVRVIAATHRNLREGVAKGHIREDFYYRIKVFDIHTPALAERKEDIPLLTEAFIQSFNRRTGKAIEGISAEVRYVFMDYCWPGNVRELENAIEHAFVTCQGKIIEMRDLPLELRTAQMRMRECRSESRVDTRRPDDTATPHPIGSREELLQVLEACEWNKAAAARKLGVERTTIWRRMKKLGIAMSVPAGE